MKARVWPVLLFLIGLLLIPAPSASGDAGDFTHFVLGEEMTATWCGFCPTAAEQLSDIYYNDSYEFYYVALITDVNDKADDRTGDYPTFQGYPTVYFDGGFRERTGAQDDKSAYQQDIEDSGERVDTPVAIELNMSYLGDSEIYVKVRLRWDEDGTIVNTDLQVFLRVYITEITSRYYNADDKPYHFGFLDYAFEEGVDLDPHEWWESETTWVGADHEDANGDDFGDIDYSNIALVAAVFNDESSDTDDYSLNCTAAIAPHLTITDPFDNTTQNGDFDLKVEATPHYTEADPASISKIEYSFGEDGWTDLDEAVGDEWSTSVDTTSLENGWHTLHVRATDSKNTTMETNVSFELDGEDTFAPVVEFVSPDDGGTMSGDVEIIAEITDHSNFTAEFRVGSGGWTELDHLSDDTYKATWDSTEVTDGDQTITILAMDEHDNDGFHHLDIVVDNLNVEMTSPRSGTEVENIVDIAATAVNTAEIDYAELLIDGEDIEELEVDGSDIAGEWNSRSVDNGEHSLTVIVYDTIGNEAADTVTVDVDNDVNDEEPPELIVDSPSEGEEIGSTYRLEATANDENGIDRVEFRFVDGDWTEMDHGDGDDYSHDLNTREMENGDYVLEFRAQDSSANKATVSLNVTVHNEVDEEAPEIEPRNPIEGDLVSLDDTFQVVLHAVDDSEMAIVESRLDSGDWREMEYDEDLSAEYDTDTYSFTYDGTHNEFNDLEDGTHTIAFRASDGSDNTAEEEVEFTTDSTPPVITLDLPSFISGEVEMGYVLDDMSDISSLEVGIAGDVLDSIDHPDGEGTLVLDLSEVEDGQVDLWAIAVDMAGNEGTGEHEATVDNTAPSLSLSSPGDGASLAGDIDIEVEVVDDNPDGVTWRMDLGPWSDMNGSSGTYSVRIPVEDVDDGWHDIDVAAEDRAGNVDELAFEVFTDNSAPMLKSIEHYPDIPYVDDDVFFEAEVEDVSGVETVLLWYEICQGSICMQADEVEMTLDGGVYMSSIAFDDHGNVTFRIKAEDALGNRDTLLEDTFDVIEEDIEDPGEVDPPEEIAGPASAMLHSLSEDEVVSGVLALEGGAYDSTKVEIRFDDGEWMDVGTRTVHRTERMPDFTLSTIDNQTITLGDLEGRVVILDFMATWCGACKEIAMSLDEIQDIYGTGVAIISVDVDTSQDERDAVPAYLDEHGHDWPFAFDENGLSDRFGVDPLPHVVIGTPDGYISSQIVGSVDVERLQLEIGMALTEREWSYYFDTRMLSNGEHTITVRTDDESETVSFYVDNGAVSDPDEDDDGFIGSPMFWLFLIALVIIIALVAARPKGRKAVHVEAQVLSPPVRPCRRCGGPLSHVPQYDRWYCYSCQAYGDIEPNDDSFIEMR